METTISDSCTSFYIPEIHQLTFHVPDVQILGTYHYGYSRQTAFKHLEYFQDLCCRSNYTEHVAAIFARQVQSEYFGCNISLSVQDISLENCSALPHTRIKASTKSCPRHAVFHFFCRMIANKILTILLHTSNVLLNCEKKENYWHRH